MLRCKADAATSLPLIDTGWRADKASLIGILCRRTASQRAAIRRAYAFLYREPLLNCFRYKLSRHHLLSVDFWVLRSLRSLAMITLARGYLQTMQVEFCFRFVGPESADLVDDGSG